MSTSDFHSLPSFLKQRLNYYWKTRYEQDWGGRHILQTRPWQPGNILVNHNDYLSLAKHPDIQKAQIESLQTYNEATMMSAVFLQKGNPQSELEELFSDYLLAEDCILSQSGYMANIGLLQTIAGPETPIFIDMLAHASLWEGIHAARAKPVPFRHNDPNHLERLLSQSNPGVIVVDSVYSTDGSIAPLQDFVGLAEKYGCVIVVDESHSLGTHGPSGAGMVVELDLQDRVTFRTASLAKTFCGRAGLTASNFSLKSFLISTSFPSIFSSALLPHEIAGLKKTLEVIKTLDQPRSHLNQISRTFRRNLINIGYTINSQSQIISPEPGKEILTMKFRDQVEASGVIGAIFCPPATPKNRACLRISLHSSLTSENISYITDVLKEQFTKQEGHKWKSSRRRNKSSQTIEPISIAGKSNNKPRSTSFLRVNGNHTA